MGHLLGKDGTDIFAPLGFAKGLKAYQDLRRTNQLFTLENLVRDPDRCLAISTEWNRLHRESKIAYRRWPSGSDGSTLIDHPRVRFYGMLPCDIVWKTKLDRSLFESLLYIGYFLHRSYSRP